jgi:hypothetical protein
LEKIIENAFSIKKVVESSEAKPEQKNTKAKPKHSKSSHAKKEPTETSDVIRVEPGKQILNFRYENTSYITSDDYKELINVRTEEKALESIVKYIKLIYLNPNHSENHNVYIPRKDMSFVKFNGSGWQPQNVKTTIHGLLNSSVSQLVDIVDSEEDNSTYNENVRGIWGSVYNNIDEPGDLRDRLTILVTDECVSSCNILSKAVREIEHGGKELSKLLK